MDDFLKYMRIKQRKEINKLCSRSFVPPPSLLKTVFNLEKLDPDDKKEIEEYRRLYKRDCVELVNKYLDKLYVKRIKSRIPLSYRNESGDINYKKISEKILNSLFKSFERKKIGEGNPFLTGDGVKLINMTFHSKDVKERIYGWGMIFSFMVGLYINSEYMDDVFKSKFMEVIPKELLEKKWLVKFLLSSVSTITFLEATKNYIKRNYDVPENFFDGTIERY